jgi:membrane protease subunit HflK
MSDQGPQIDLNNLKPPSLNPKTIQSIVVGLLIVVVIYKGWFTINPEEVGIVLRFGEYKRTVESGLHFKIPLIEEVEKVPVERQMKEEFGFRTAHSGVRSEYSNLRFQDESLMLTGDLNSAEVEWIVQYRIQDPYKYLFKVRNAIQTFRDINEAVMRRIVGDRTVNEVLTIGRQEIASTVEMEVQQLCDAYETGIKVEQVVLQNAMPPDKVKPSFNEVNEAQQEKEKLINQAQSEYNRVIPKARGEAERKIEEARGYALERINEAKGNAERFTALYNEYAKAKEVTKQRMYLETMNDVLSKVGKKLITDDKASGVLPLFNFNQEGKK